MILVSTYVYGFAKHHGPTWKDKACKELAAGLASSEPWARTVSEAQRLEPSAVHLAAPGRLSAGRSATAGALLRSDADVWLTNDDDVDARAEVLSRLVRAARITRGIVSGPCLQRNSTHHGAGAGLLNIRMHEEPKVVEGDGFTLASITQTGMGLVAMHREAIEAMALAHPELEIENEETREVYPALFAEEIQGRKWYGEDFAFSRRARLAGVPMHALCSATVLHDGRRCELELVDGEPFFRVYDLK